MEKEIVLITGASSGFGLLTTIELVKKGFHVIATMRNQEKQKAFWHEIEKQKVDATLIDVVFLDVTKHNDINDIKEYVVEKYGHLDILINNAGYCLGGITETLSVQDFKAQFDTNFFGAVAMTNAFLPSMRKRRKGKIINVGSISGSFGFPAMAPYTSSKFALRGYSESLRLEVLPFGVYVSLLEPGSYQTNIWEKGLSGIAQEMETDYKPMNDVIYSHALSAKENGQNPIRVAQKIRDICTAKKPLFYYGIGYENVGLRMAKKWFPWSWIEKLVVHKLKGKKGKK